MPLPDAEEQLLWIQVIDGELTLNSKGSPQQSLRRGDGVGLIQEAATQGELIGLSERADVLLFALACSNPEKIWCKCATPDLVP